MNDNIIIEGIETNNLKNIDVKIQKNALNLIIGPSGSGKSSLAYDTISQIGQNEFMTMFADEVKEPSYKVKTFSNMMVTVPIKQTNYNNNLRSTIGTYFAFNRSIALIYAILLDLPEDLFVLNKESNLCEKCNGLGFVNKPDYNKIIDYNVPLENVPFRCWNRNKDFFSQIIINFCNDNNINYKKTFRDISKKEKDLLLFGISSKKYSIRYKKTNAYSRRTSNFYGVLTGIPMLPNFHIGKSYFSEFECEYCRGKKYSKDVENFKIQGISIGEFMTTEFVSLKQIVNNLAKNILDDRLSFSLNRIKRFVEKAIELNLGHLFFHRSIPTLSGGELQRLRMVQIFTTQLSNLIFVLDEPLSGLSGEEKKSVYDNITSLDKKHTIVLVDHGETFYKEAKNVIALGEGGGSNGGRLINPIDYIKEQSITETFVPIKAKLQTKILLDTPIYKYRGVQLTIANNCMNLIFGNSGVGKSTLLREYFPQFFNNYLYINQKPLLGNKNSCVATVLGIATRVYEIFAKKHKKDKKFFSNLTGNEGACPCCGGAGYIEYGDDYHSVTQVECRECEGTGFNRVLKRYKINEASIFDIWKMTLDEASVFFKDIDKSITKSCLTSSDIMLGHLRFGQPTETLSGGENIRIKIIKVSKSNSNTIGIDEPFKGLNNTEIKKVAMYLDNIRKNGKTLIIVDHTVGIEKYFSRVIKLISTNSILIGEAIK